MLVSSRFLPALLETEPQSARRQTAYVVLAENQEAAAAFVAMGVRGAVYRTIDGPSLVEAVRRVASGGAFLHSPKSAITEIHEDIVGVHVVDRLSEMELYVIAAVFRSCTNREIAQQLGTNEQSVKQMMRSIFDKTGVSDRLALALFVFHHRMLEHAVQAVRIDGGLPYVRRVRNIPAPYAPAGLSLAAKALSEVDQRQLSRPEL